MHTSRGRWIAGFGALLIGTIAVVPASAHVSKLAEQFAPRLAEGWGTSGQTRGDHRLKIIVSDGMCGIHETPPYVSGVKLIERPETATRPFKSAVIQAYVVAPVRAAPPAPQYRVVPLCAGVGWSEAKWIRFKRPVRELFLYSGHFDPPRRVWPRLGLSLKETWAKVERAEQKQQGG